MRHKDVVRIGCGAGFAGDRPAAALRLLQKVPDMHYLVLECLAERTLAVRYQTMVAGGKGFDPRSKSPPLPHLSHCLLHWPELKVLKSYPKATVALVCLHITKGCKSSQFLMERFVNLCGVLNVTVSEWMRLLLPTAVRKGVCLITNMGAGQFLHDASSF
jgi:hypothetical protein